MSTAAPAVKLPFRGRLSTDGLREHGPVVVLLVVLFVANIIEQPVLWDVTQIGLLLQTALPLVFVGLAQTLVIIIGGLDLSVGGTLVLGSAVSAQYLDGGSGGLVILATVLIGAGLLNGVLVTYGRFAPFIVTFATWSIFNGIGLQILPQDGGVVPNWLITLVTGETVGLPNAYLIVAASLLFWWHLRRTSFGRDMFAIGSDDERARLNGIRIKRVRVAVFVLSAVIAGIGGVLLAGTTSTGQPTVGDAYILQSIAAVVIGGTALSGGRGGYGLTLIGALILTLIATLVQSLNLDSWVTVGASSLLLLVVVAARSLVSREGEGRLA